MKWDTGTNIRSCTYHTGYKLFIFRAVWNKNVVFAASAVELGSALKTFENSKNETATLLRNVWSLWAPLLPLCDHKPIKAG